MQPKLYTVDEEEEGVYIIWYETPRPGRVIYVGQGNIKERLQEHRRNPDITKYDNQHGRLLVSWASVVEDDRDGIERHLADTFPPKVGKIHPNAEHILVNAPWGWPS